MLRLQTERQLDDLKEVNVEEVIIYIIFIIYLVFLFIFYISDS